MAEVIADVREERRGAALWLTIDREERRNALNEGVLDALRAASRPPRPIRRCARWFSREPATRCSAPAAT